MLAMVKWFKREISPSSNGGGSSDSKSKKALCRIPKLTNARARSHLFIFSIYLGSFNRFDKIMISLLQNFFAAFRLAASTRILFHIEFYYLQMGQKQKQKRNNQSGREMKAGMLSTLSPFAFVCVFWWKFLIHSDIVPCLVFSLCHFSSLFVFVFQPTHTHTFHLRCGVEKFFFFLSLFSLLWALSTPALNFHRVDASFSTHLSFSCTFFTVNTG